LAYLAEHAPALLPAPRRAARTWLAMAVVALTMITGGLLAMVRPAVRQRRHRGGRLWLRAV